MPIKKRIEGADGDGGGWWFGWGPLPYPRVLSRQVSKLTVLVRKIGPNCPFADNERNPCERTTLVGKVEKKGLGEQREVGWPEK